MQRAGTIKLIVKGMDGEQLGVGYMVYYRHSSDQYYETLDSDILWEEANIPLKKLEAMYTDVDDEAIRFNLEEGDDWGEYQILNKNGNQIGFLVWGIVFDEEVP